MAQCHFDPAITVQGQKRQMQPHPLREPDKFVVRLPEGMRSIIAEMAKSNRRSMNSEIVFHLEQAMASQGITNKTASESVPALPKASPEA